jgi:hypothetical protein
MRQDAIAAFEAFIERKWLDALNIAAAEPASWKGDGERAVGGARAPDKVAGSGREVLRVTGAVNVVEQRESPRSPSPLWELSLGRKCRARNLIGCDGDHVMLQCEKLMSLGLAERREVLEKSGLCMFCLKHPAELECYGRGGLSKPRCTKPGCDGERTPGVHKLMGEDSAGVNLIAEDGSEDEDEAREEDEDEGWWVGTVGVMETLNWTEETSRSVSSLGQSHDNDHGEAEDGGQFEYVSEPLLGEYSAGEMAEDKWWDLEPDCPSFEGGESSASQSEALKQPPSNAAWPPRPGGAGQRKMKRRPKATADQNWEEARRSAWLRQMLSDTSSDEDEDEERYGRFAESGRWMSELYGVHQHLAPTSGGECSG